MSIHLNNCQKEKHKFFTFVRPFSAFFSNLLNTQNIKIWGLFFQWALKHWAKNMGDGSRVGRPLPCYTKLPPPPPQPF